MAEAAGTCPRLLNYRLAGPGEYPISPRIVPTRAKELGFAAAYAWRGTCAIWMTRSSNVTIPDPARSLARKWQRRLRRYRREFGSLCGVACVRAFSSISSSLAKTRIKSPFS